MKNINVSDQKIVAAIQNIIEECGGKRDSFEADLITQQIQTSLRLLTEGHNTGQMKLITRALKEMRYAYHIFNEYPSSHRVSIFGSARTPEDHPNYHIAEEFSKSLTKHGWMCITGAASGIMKAGMAGGASAESSFGLSIRLPFEEPNNRIIEGDPKLISFRYFFTRKLMFMSHSNAIAIFPGGFGTLDELFEMLTLIQTGRGAIIPVVLMEEPNGVYWHHFKNYIEKNLLANGCISQEDLGLFYIARAVNDGVKHILQFYRRYHSSRYVKDDFVIRMLTPITQEQVKLLNQKFSRLVKSGSMRLSKPLPGEDDFLDLPRLVFHHTRKYFGLMRMLIDEINRF